VGDVAGPPVAATFVSATPSDTEPEPGVELAETRNAKPCVVDMAREVAPFVATMETTTAFAASVTMSDGGVNVVEAEDVPETMLDVAITGFVVLPFTRP
jgi:hypothetical protein